MNWCQIKLCNFLVYIDFFPTLKTKKYTHIYFNAYLVLILIISYSQRMCLLYLLILFNQQNTHNISYRVKSRGATAIFIAHRLASIQHCDLILVLKDGQIGKYMSLYCSIGWFPQMVEAGSNSQCTNK